MGIDKLRFLVVDDHGFQRWAVRNMLQAMGATQVHVAPDGASAMEMCRKLKPEIDVVITDLDMPGMDGMQLIRQLAGNGMPASLVVISGLDQGVLETVRSMGDAYGASVIAVLTKPASMNALRAAIETHVSRVATSGTRRAAGPSAVEVAGALHEDEIEPSFEPRVDIRTRLIVGAQVTPVWAQPSGRVMLARSFMDVARDAGLLPQLGWQLLRKALVACAEWQNAGIQLAVCVPVAGESLRDPSYAERVQRSMAAVALHPGTLMLHLDAAPHEHGVGTMLENISRLRMLGFGISLPYGAQTRHREQLARSGCSELGVDVAALPRPLGDNEHGVVAVATAAAHAAGASVCALGVRFREDWELAISLGADTAVGPAFGAPLLAPAFVEETRRRPEWKGFR